MKVLAGKTVLITGASRGIGKATAIAFAKAGADIGFTHLAGASKVQSLEKELQELGVRAKAYQSDASSLEASIQLVETFLQDFSKLDILINNAGIIRDAFLVRMTEAQFDDVIANNLKSVFNLCKASVKEFMKRRSGSIINLSSYVAQRGNPLQTNYAASKGGIISFTKALALELAPRNVRVNAIAPGFIETEMTASLNPKVLEQYVKNIPLGRSGTAQEVADLAVFLASDQSAYITGQVIAINGGLYT